MRTSEPTNAFTVDVEDYFHVSGFEQDIHRDQWNSFDSRVVANTQHILELLDGHDVKATFFVLGWVARRFPGLVREIHAGGHEIGSHSYWHRLIYRQTPREFRSDLRASRQIIEDAIGEPIHAFRAPSFSITKKSRWALDILADEGFRLDSSIFPTHHDRYGIPDAEPAIHQVATPSGPLWEFPPTVAQFARWRIPVGGGGYFRLYPLRWTFFCLSRINRTAGRPFLFYVHPWEIDPRQPRLRAGTRAARFRHRVNLSSTERRLVALLGTFRFGRLCDVVRSVDDTAIRNKNGVESARPFVAFGAPPVGNVNETFQPT